ncbi:unnamed protein product [Anisakis simplex]|uniref:Clathrin light chain n=1 Tax=Anisakis simplex TaxID=6269 RepID=A0A0M3K2L9_ANISI|nr:unnamed protein product [Anisakis simplex]
MSDPVADFLAREQNVLADIDGAPVPDVANMTAADARTTAAAPSLPDDTVLVEPPPIDNGVSATMNNGISHFTTTANRSSNWDPTPFFTSTQPAAAFTSVSATDHRAKCHDDFHDFEHLNGGGDSGVDLSALDAMNNLAGGAQVVPQIRSSASATPSPLTINSMPKIEPEKIRKWREEHKILLEKKDEAEEKKKIEMRAAAKKELDEWYAQREEQLNKTKIANRKAESEILADRDACEEGAEWDRIAKLCEFNAKNSKNTTDVSRLRSILLQLKSHKPSSN